MKSKIFAAICLFVLALSLCSCKENPVIEETTVSARQEIVYAYVTTQVYTNAYGGVTGHENYLCYGVLNGDNVEAKEDCIDFVTVRTSSEDYSYIEYYYDRKIYEDGTNYDVYAGAALYLTKDMLANLKTNL